MFPKMKGKINLVPSIADVLFVAILIRLSLLSSSLLADGDTGIHIRAGEYILNTLAVPTHDIFSYVTPAPPWTYHHWLSGAIMALVHRAFGLNGIVLFFSFLVSSIFYLLFKILRSYKGNILTAIIVVVLVITSSQVHWLARPHVFTLLFLVVWYYLLDLYQYRDRNYLYLLPPIMLLWVNMHAAFVLGFTLLGVYLAGNIVLALSSGGGERKSYGRKALILALAMFFCIFASLVNPYGYHILLFPLEVYSNTLIMDNVMEFLSPNFHEPMPFKYMLFLMIAVLAISRTQLNVIEIALVLISTYMALYSVRNIPIFAIIAAPVLVRQIDLLVEGGTGRLSGFLKKRSERIGSIDSLSRGYFWPLAATLLVVGFFAAGSLDHNFDEKDKPLAAMEFLKTENIPGNMFNKDEFGDFIIYAAWPRYKPLFDGRIDIHGPGGLEDFLRVASVKPGLEKILDKYDANWIIYPSGSALSYFLLQKDDWKLIYSDGVADIFIRNTAENRRLIERYKDVKPVEKAL